MFDVGVQREVVVSVANMPRKRDGEIPAQKVFMRPVSLPQAIKDGAQKTGRSESETIRDALKNSLGKQATD